MSTEEDEQRERHFVEELGIMFEGIGGQRMMGRILGRLLVCDPAHQSSAQLADYLLASRGAISTATRSLLASGFVERLSLPGDRSTYFRLKDDAWARSLEAELAKTRLIRELADRGVALVAHRPDHVRHRLQEFRDLFRFWEEELPVLLDHWRAKRGLT